MTIPDIQQPDANRRIAKRQIRATVWGASFSRQPARGWRLTALRRARGMTSAAELPECANGLNRKNHALRTWLNARPAIRSMAPNNPLGVRADGGSPWRRAASCRSFDH